MSSNQSETGKDSAQMSAAGITGSAEPTPNDGKRDPETIRISLSGLSDADADRLRQIQKQVAERPGDENAMESACGEYNCPCHYQIGFLLEVIAKTATISLPALRAVILGVIDDGWECPLAECKIGHAWVFPLVAPSDFSIEQRLLFCDEITRRLRQLPARG